MKTRNVARAVCLTPACIQLASDYVKNLSPNYKQLDPCTDFEEMICGGWRDSHPLTPGTVGGDSINVLGELSKGGLAKLRATLEGSYPGGSSQAELADQSVDEQNFNTLKLAFSSCMDNKAIEAAGAEPILDLLDRLQESFVGANGSDWTNTNSFLHSIGSSGLVFFGTKIDDGDPNKKTIQVMPNLLYGLSASAYQDPNNVTEYTAVLTEILGKLYPRSSPVGASDAKKLAERVIRFETDLSRIHANSITTGIKGAKQLSPAEASKLIPQFDFERIIRTFAPKEYQPGNMTVLETPLLANISRLLTDTPPETVKAYFTWRTIVAVQDKVIAPDVFDRWYKLSPNRGSMSSLERSFYCTYYISKDLSWLVARFFIESFFSAYGKQLGEQIIADIRHAYIEKLSALSWMDDETKKKAVEKVNKMAQRVGYPAEVSLLPHFPSILLSPQPTRTNPPPPFRTQTLPPLSLSNPTMPPSPSPPPSSPTTSPSPTTPFSSPGKTSPSPPRNNGTWSPPMPTRNISPFTTTSCSPRPSSNPPISARTSPSPSTTLPLAPSQATKSHMVSIQTGGSTIRQGTR